MMAASTTRWWVCRIFLAPLLFFFLLFQGSRVDGQLTLGDADSFLPEHLDPDAAAAVTTTGKTLEITPLSDASTTNAAVAAAAAAADAVAAAEPGSDLNSPVVGQSDDYLILTGTDSPLEETTEADFVDYNAEETEATTEFLGPPDTEVTEQSDGDTVNYLADEVQVSEEVTTTTTSPPITRRIIFTDVEDTLTTPLPSVQSVRPSSVVRVLDDPATDTWRPNWPSQLLETTEEPSNKASVRFPTGSPPVTLDDTPLPSATTVPPHFTVTKVPVTQYYFDLESVSPSGIPGPLFDLEDVVSSSAVPSLHSDVTHPLDLENTESNLSELQSSVLMDARESPIISTPALPFTTTSLVVAGESVLPLNSPVATQRLSPTSTALNEVVGGHIQHDNTLVEQAEAGNDTNVKENPEGEVSEVIPSGMASTVSSNESTTVAEAQDNDYSSVDTTTTPQSTSQSPPPLTQSPPVPSNNSEPLTTTTSSVTTPGSVKPSSVRTSQATKSSRIPLWQRLSQSSPSRPVKTPLPSTTPLTPSVATTLAVDPVTPITSAAPPTLESSPIEPPVALEPLTPMPESFPSTTESTQESRIPEGSDPFTPLDIDDPDEVLTMTVKNETESVAHDNTDPFQSTTEHIEPPLINRPEIVPEVDPDQEVPHNITSKSSDVDTPLTDTVDQHLSLDNQSISIGNESTVDVVDNALDSTHTNIDDTTSENKTQHGNEVIEESKGRAHDPLLTSPQDEDDSLIDPSKVLVTSPSTETSPWTPIVDVTESIPTSVTTSLVLTTTSATTSQSPPELLSGFTPVTATSHTASMSHSEVVPSDSSASNISSSTVVDFAMSTPAIIAPSLDPSTPSAPSHTLTASLATPTAVQKTTDSEFLDDYSSFTESVYQSLQLMDEPLSSDYPVTLFTQENEHNFILLNSSVLVEPLHTSRSTSPEFIVSDLQSSIDVTESIIFTDSIKTFSDLTNSEIFPSPYETPLPDHIFPFTHKNSPTVLQVSGTTLTTLNEEIIPSSYETLMHDQSYSFTHKHFPSVPPVSGKTVQILDEAKVTHSSRPPDLSNSLIYVSHQTITEYIPSSTFTDTPMSSPVPVNLNVYVTSVSIIPSSPGVTIVPEVPVSSSVPVLPLDVPVSSAVPALPEAPVASTLLVVPTVSHSPTIPDVAVSSVVSVTPEAPVASTPLVVPTVSHSPTIPDVVVSSVVPVSPEAPVSSSIPMSTSVPILPDSPTSAASVDILPTPSLTPTPDSSTLVVPTATDEPTTHTALPPPVHPDEDGEEATQQEVPDKESAPEPEPEPEPEAEPKPEPEPEPDTEPPPKTTITTSSTTSSTTTITTETPSSTVASTERPITVLPNTTTTLTSPESTVNGTMLGPGKMPALTTETLLENGTTVIVELPYIRALVDYNSSEFCQRKHDFRTMFAEWITQNLNGSVRQVIPRDIRFFAMAECPVSVSWEDQFGHEERDTNDAMMQEENHTQVYFYVTSGGEADPELTEKFPLFPTDLLISERLMYLVPRVMELEVVRPDDSSSQDQLQEAAVGTSVIVIIVICSIVGVTIIVVLFFFMVVKRRGATNNYYGRRCTPVSMDAYSMDSVSVYHSFRRKSKRRASGRSMKSYLNQAFDDPNGPSRPLNFAKLTHFISDIDGVHEEFATIPVNMPKYDELPAGVEDKNRYANVIPVPETRVLLKVTKDGRNCEYINANFVRGARNESKYYIATQAPLDETVADFWRMIWEQESRVVVMLTDFVEKGIDKCADYLPPSETLDCHRVYGDFQVTLKSRDMREKFVVSHVQLKNLENNLMREVAHMWFTGWPASGVPNEEGAFISFILEVRRTRKKLRAKGPIVVHCSPGTGRTGTLLASDIVMKQFEEHRTIDVARTVYAIRRDRAGAVQTKEQYAFIYRVINLYASKLTSGNLESL